MAPRTAHKQRPLPPRPSWRSWVREHMLQIVASCALLCVVALYAGISYVSFRPALQITGVTVIGTSLLHADEISATITKELRGTRWGSISKNTVYTAPLTAIHDQLLETYPEINTLALSRNFLTATITATIVEHTVYAIWCAEDSDVCYYMTRDGYIFAPAPYDPRYTRWYSAMPPTALRANIGGDYIRIMTDTIDGISFLELTPTAVHIAEENKELRIDLGPWYVRTRTTVPAADTLRFIRAALTSKEFIAARPQLEYLDARFGNRLFYKEKPVEKVVEVSADTPSMSQ
jgi:hypothetical protein